MSDNDVLNVAIREGRGSGAARKLRASGQTPAVLYGHGEESVSLSVGAADLTSFVRRGQKLAKLAGAVSESALVRELQWDAMGNDILHVDFTRVNVGDMVETTVSVELRGECSHETSSSLGVKPFPFSVVDLEIIFKILSPL